MSLMPNNSFSFHATKIFHAVMVAMSNVSCLWIESKVPLSKSNNGAIFGQCFEATTEREKIYTMKRTDTYQIKITVNMICFQWMII